MTDKDAIGILSEWLENGKKRKEELELDESVIANDAEAQAMYREVCDLLTAAGMMLDYYKTKPETL